MQELDVAISRARRRRRPTTAYGVTEGPAAGGTKHEWSSGSP